MNDFAKMMCLTTLVGILLVAPDTRAAGVRTQLQVTSDGSSTGIGLSNPFLFSNPGALVIVSQLGWAETRPVSVYYSAGWFVWNGGPDPIPAGAIFNVLAFDEASGFRHVATAGNITDNFTTLDDSRLNGNPSARPIVQRESTGIWLSAPYGVWYNGTTNRWTIFSQDVSPMPVGAAFIVFVPGADDDAFVHTATAGNTTSNFTALSGANVDPFVSQRLFITQLWTGTYNDEEVAVSWLLAYLVGNTSSATMPVGANFNVWVAPIFQDGFEMGSSALWSDTVP